MDDILFYTWFKHIKSVKTHSTIPEGGCGAGETSLDSV